MSVNQQQEQGQSDSQEPEKSEVLLLDKDDRVREAFGKILTTEGFILTSTDDHERVLSLTREKHYAVALLDLDTPEPEKGFELLERVRTASPATQVVLISNRQTFDIATRGFRSGAADVVAKSPDSVKYLTDKVSSLCMESRRGSQRDKLLKDVLELHDDFLKRLMEAFRKAREAEDVATGQSGARLTECIVLVVDDNPRTAPGLKEALGQERYSCVSATNGGEALDYATSSGFHIALVKEQLPDLSGTMVSRSLQANSPDGIVLIFDHPGQEPGYLSLVEKDQTIELIPELRRPEQLVGVVNELREAYMAKNKEKRHLQAFRQENLDFLKRYVEFRQKVVKILPDANETR
jgi:DNA-binding response OmpR family regulator